MAEPDTAATPPASPEPVSARGLNLPLRAQVLERGAALASRLEQFGQLALVLLLAVGCWKVLAPFFPAILFALVIATSTWPAYRRLHAALRGRSTLASLVACLLTVLLALGPLVLLMMSLADAAGWVLGLIERVKAQNLGPAPDWLARLPLLGPAIAGAWAEISADPARLKEMLSFLAAPAREAALVSGRALGNASLQVTLTALLLFFLYRQGEALSRTLRAAAERMGGESAQELVSTARHSVTGVLFGVLGAGLAQATLATIGFALAGVPNPFLLGALTFVLSMVPVGPPLVWGGAAIWLFQHGEAGWGVFMLVYGMLGISAVDNVLKPLLISRASHLPFAFTLMGVVGGVLAFGVMGVFLGPTLLALSVDLGGQWLGRSAARSSEAESTAAPAPPPSAA